MDGRCLPNRFGNTAGVSEVTSRPIIHAAKLSIDRAVITVDSMVNTAMVSRRSRMLAMGVLVRVYVAIVLGTVVALGILSVAAPAQATRDAWGHAVIVAVFAVLLPLRLRSARAGSRGGLRAVGLISAALFLVNVIEVMIPGLFPVWLRAVMVGIAVLMAAVVGLVVREAHTEPHR